VAILYLNRTHNKKEKTKDGANEFLNSYKSTYLDLKSALKLIELFGIRSLPFKYSNSLQFMRRDIYLILSDLHRFLRPLDFLNATCLTSR